MAAMDLLGRRWTLRVLWELRGGPVGARALLAACDGLSSSVLYERLHDLSDASLIVQGDTGQYEQTKLGRELGDSLQPLDAWARRFVRNKGKTPLQTLLSEMTQAIYADFKKG